MLNTMIIFKIHQPFIIKKLSIFDIGKTDSILDYDLSKNVIEQISDLSYIPSLELLFKMIDNLKGQFKFSICFSGILIEQLKLFKPYVIELLKRLIETKMVEVIATPFYNSLSFIFDENQFVFEVNKDINLIYSEFNYFPSTFMNTELIYSNKLADYLRGFVSIKRIITEPTDKTIGFKPPFNLYKAYGKNTQTIILRNQKLSDYISFNFLNKNFKDYPITAEKFSKWIIDINYSYKKIKNIYNTLVFDLETFGYHYKENSGIFEFLYDMPKLVIKNGKNNVNFIKPEEVEQLKEDNLDVFNSKDYISSSGEDKNLNLMLGNDLQKNSQSALYNLINLANEQNNENLLEILRKISSVDYAYFLSDSNMFNILINKFFAHYPTTESAYQNFLYILSDVEEKLS